MTTRTSLGRALAVAAMLAAGPAASAQTTAERGNGLLLGPLTLRPVLVLRDAGIDSNVFNVSGGDTEDRTAVASATTDARMRVGIVQIDGAGGAEYLYFQRYTGERAVNRFVSAKLQPQFIRVRPFVGAGYTRTRDRANSEIDVRAPRTEHEYSGGLEAQLTTRATLQASMRRAEWRFDEGERFRDIDLATRLNRHADSAVVSLLYELSPLTMLTVRTTLSRERYDSSSDRNSDALQSEAGFMFAPDAIVRGRAIVGFRDVRPRGERSAPSRGPTAGIELSYTLLDRTVFSGRLAHERIVSVENHPFYLSTLAGLEVTHNLVGPLDLIARASRERLNYEAIELFNLPAHLDRMETLGGGVALRLGSRIRLSANYEDIRRRSDAPDARDYDRRRLYTTVSYGF